MSRKSATDASFATKTSRNDRFAQMSRQEQVIEQKKREIQARLQQQQKVKPAATTATTKQTSTDIIKKPATAKPLWKGNLSNKTPQNTSNKSGSLFNVFSNDGSFLDQFKQMSDIKKNFDQKITISSIKCEKVRENAADRVYSDERSKPSRWSKSRSQPINSFTASDEVIPATKKVSRFSDLPAESLPLPLPPPYSVAPAPAPVVFNSTFALQPPPPLLVPPPLVPPRLVPPPLVQPPLVQPPLVQPPLVQPPALVPGPLIAPPPPAPGAISVPPPLIPKPAEPIPPSQSQLQSQPQPPEPINTLSIPPPAPLQLQNIPQPSPIRLAEIPQPKPIDLLNIPAPGDQPPPSQLPNASTATVKVDADFIKNVPPPNKCVPPPGMVVANVTVPPPPIPSLMAQPIPPPPGMAVPPPLLTQPPPMNFPPPALVPAPDITAGSASHDAMVSLGRVVAQCGSGIEDIVQQRSKQDPALWFLFHKQSAAYQQYRTIVEQYRAELPLASTEYQPEDLYEPDNLTDEESATSAPASTIAAMNTSRKRKRKSRWGDTGVASIGTTTSPMLSKITRSDPGLIQYAVNTFGNSAATLTEEEWLKAEDHYKIQLLYQDMVRKRQELERLQRLGRHKYEYDSDEETDGGTWEHKVRNAEMEATQCWADELTRQAEGKHHIGDFLPPDELHKFLEKYSACKEGRQPNLSDYKEFKLTQDNVGFQMLQKLGWQEGQGLGAEGTGIRDPVNKATVRDANQGLGLGQPDAVADHDDEYDAYRKRMMLAYRFRPNPLNNPRRPYY